MEKGSMLTAIEHGSVGPKRMAKAISESKAVYANARMNTNTSSTNKVSFQRVRMRALSANAAAVDD